MRAAKLFRALAAVLAVGLIGACGGTSNGADVAPDSLGNLARRTSLAQRSFTDSSTIAGRTVTVKGLVEDDHRYSATVSVDGELVYEEVVADDARYLRVADPTELAPGGDVAALVAIDPSLAVVTSGVWVVDEDGAPAEFVQGDRLPPVPLSPQLVLERVRLLEGFNQLLSKEPVEYNTKAINYLRKNDKFEEHKESGKRFDVIPGSYDPNRSITTMDAIEEQFQYMSIWAKPDRISRIEQLLEIPPRNNSTYRELHRQVQSAGSESLQNLFRMGDRGRHLTRTVVIDDSPEAKSVVVPADAQPVDLGPALVKLGQTFAAAVKVPGPLTGRPT